MNKGLRPNSWRQSRRSQTVCEGGVWAAPTEEAVSRPPIRLPLGSFGSASKWTGKNGAGDCCNSTDDEIRAPKVLKYLPLRPAHVIEAANSVGEGRTAELQLIVKVRPFGGHQRAHREVSALPFVSANTEDIRKTDRIDQNNGQDSRDDQPDTRPIFGLDTHNQPPLEACLNIPLYRMPCQ